VQQNSATGRCNAAVQQDQSRLPGLFHRRVAPTPGQGKCNIYCFGRSHVQEISLFSVAPAHPVGRCNTCCNKVIRAAPGPLLPTSATPSPHPLTTQQTLTSPVKCSAGHLPVASLLSSFHHSTFYSCLSASMSEQQRLILDMEPHNLEATIAYLESLNDAPAPVRALTRSLRQSARAGSSSRSSTALAEETLTAPKTNHGAQSISSYKSQPDYAFRCFLFLFLW